MHVPSVTRHIRCSTMHRFIFFFFTATATTEIYTLSLHDALPICPISPRDDREVLTSANDMRSCARSVALDLGIRNNERSEEHTSELQSRLHLVCRLLLEKKKIIKPLTLHRSTLDLQPFSLISKSA